MQRGGEDRGRVARPYRQPERSNGDVTYALAPRHDVGTAAASLVRFWSLELHSMSLVSVILQVTLTSFPERLTTFVSLIDWDERTGLF